MNTELENKQNVRRKKNQLPRGINQLRTTESESIMSNDECKKFEVGKGSASEFVDQVEEPLPDPQLCNEATQTIDLGTLLTKEVTDSGSFDIRGDIWATTFGKVLQAIPIAAILIDKSFHIAVANQACSKISVQYESILGSSFSYLFLDNSSIGRTQSTLEEVFNDRRPRQVETMLQINEDWIWARITFRSIRVKTDRFVLALIEDLTAEKGQLMLNQTHERSLNWEINARKRAEEALRLSESRFRAIYHKLPVMIHVFDGNSMVRSVNAQWLKEMGYMREEVVGKPIDYFLSERSRKTFRAICSDLWKAGGALKIHCQYVKKDATAIDVLADCVVTNDPKWGPVSLTASRYKLTNSY
jgi:PAS domain-containing protein